MVVLVVISITIVEPQPRLPRSPQSLLLVMGFKTLKTQNAMLYRQCPLLALHVLTVQRHKACHKTLLNRLPANSVHLLRYLRDCQH